MYIYIYIYVYIYIHIYIYIYAFLVVIRKLKIKEALFGKDLDGSARFVPPNRQAHGERTFLCKLRAETGQCPSKGIISTSRKRETPTGDASS